MGGEWIFPDHDPVFDEPVDLGRLESYTALARARKQKGANMATKKNAATTTATKENTVQQPTLIDIPAVPAPTTATTKPAKKENAMTNAKPKKFYIKLADRIADRAKRGEEVKGAEPAPFEIKNANPEKTTKNFTDLPSEVELLRRACTFYGWTDDEWTTVAQAETCGGTLVKHDVYWNIAYKDKKDGAKFAVTIFPRSAFEWKTGKPEVDEEAKAAKAEKAEQARIRRQLRDAKAAAKEAGLDPKTGKPVAPKTTTKPKATNNAPVAPVKKVYKMADGSTIEYETPQELKELLAILKSA